MTLKNITALVAVSSEDISGKIRRCLDHYGVKDIHEAYTMYQGVALMHDVAFNMFVIDGRLLVSSNQNKVRIAGVDFVRFIRMCEGPVSEAHILFLPSEGQPEGLIAANNEVVQAWDGGASCVLPQPITRKKFKDHVVPVLEHPYTFVRDRGYIGPCRRRVDHPVARERRGKAGGAG